MDRCIDSMLDHAVVDDIEILLVNDGSTDSTSALLHSYADRYPGTVRVVDKANGGWGTAINMGISLARGKYLKEVDADDWVTTGNLPEYVAFLKGHDIDYIATEYTEYLKADNRYERHTYQKQVCGRPMRLDYFWRDYPSAWDFPIHAITYRTGMLRQSGIKVGDRYYGDIEYNLYPLLHVRNICVLPLNVTVYFRGSDTQSTSTKGYAKHYKDFVAMSQRLTLFHQSLPTTMQPNLLRFIESTVQGAVTTSYHLMMSPLYAGKTEGMEHELKLYDNWLKLTSPALYRHTGRQRRRGIAYIRLWRLFKINLLNLRK